MYYCVISMHALDTRHIILSILLIVMSNLSDTVHITSEFDINQTNAKTCCWRGIGALPKAFPWGTRPVAPISWQRTSAEAFDILKWLLNSSMEYIGVIFSQKPSLRWWSRLINIEIAPMVLISSSLLEFKNISSLADKSKIDRFHVTSQN